MTAGGVLANITVVVLGRSSGRRSGLVELLLGALAGEGAKVERFEPRYARLAHRLDHRFRGVVGKLFGEATIHWFFRNPTPRKLTKFFLVLVDPWLWPIMIGHLRRRESPVRELRQLVRKRRRGGESILFLSHSAGGILGARTELEPGVLGHVCFGYPFKHPERAEEPYRTDCLRRIEKPFVIFQGDRDAYGTLDDARRYVLSPRIVLHAVAGGHDYDDVCERDRLMMLDRVEGMLAGLDMTTAAASGSEGGVGGLFSMCETTRAA